MRRLLLPALALLTVPAAAQDDGRQVDEETVVVRERSGDVDGREVRVRVERDGPRVVVRSEVEGEVEERVIEVDLDGPVGLLESALGDAARLGEVLRRVGGSAGTSPETAARMRELQTEARDLARRTREAQGRDRRDAEADLDRVLGELFDVRAQARREQAAHLRDRADALRAEADELEAALRERDGQRAALIEARRAELLGEPGADW